MDPGCGREPVWAGQKWVPDVAEKPPLGGPGTWEWAWERIQRLLWWTLQVTEDFRIKELYSPQVLKTDSFAADKNNFYYKK